MNLESSHIKTNLYPIRERRGVMASTKKQKIACEKWRRKNRKQAIKATRKWCLKNRKRIAAYKRAYVQKNRKQIKIYVRKNRERYAAYARASYRKNPEAYITSSKKYSQTMRCRYSRILQRAARLRVRGVRGRTLSSAQHRNKLQYPNGRRRSCQYCQNAINLGGGGLDRINSDMNYTNANTVPCCASCNVWKGPYHSYAETMLHFKPMRDSARK
jgi:hypothetical protein